jgi:IclR family transcriptional regulator, acetate operon repressor
MLVAHNDTNGSGKDLAKAAGLPVPTAHHLLVTLTETGLLSKDENARYYLGPRTAVLCDAYQRDLSAPGYLVAPLRELAKTTGETGYLAAWRSGNIHLLAVVDGKLPVRVSVPVGDYMDAHARATGKLLLAYASENIRNEYLKNHKLRKATPATITSRRQLEEEFEVIRERGYSIDEQEFQVGVSCVSAPFLDGETIVASYTVSVPSERFQARREELVAAVLDCASGVTSAVDG